MVIYMSLRLTICLENKNPSKSFDFDGCGRSGET